MAFWDLFKKKEVLEPVDFGLLKVDMHSHLIPGIDDGAKTMDDTIAMLAKFESMGYQKVITTPHIYSDCYKNTPEIIRNGLEKVRETANALGLRIEIDAAAEYYCDEYFMNVIKNDEFLSIDGKYVLIEFPFMSEMDDWNAYVFQLQAKGFIPIIAHFERYLYWHGSVSVAKEMKELGCKIQLNVNSLTGHYGPDVKKQAERLIDGQLVDFLATDCHRIQHLLLMESKADLPYYHKLFETNNLLNHSLLG